jgi:hypothetical protein
MDAYFGIRFLYVFICWGVLLGAIHISESHGSVLTSLMLFFIPLSLDYYNHVPRNAADEKRKNVGIWLPAMLFAVFLVILMINIPFVNNIINSFFKYLLGVLAFYFVLLASKDWIAYSSSEELEVRSNTRDVHRHNIENERMSDRKRHYQKMYQRTFVRQKSTKRGKGR